MEPLPKNGHSCIILIWCYSWGELRFCIKNYQNRTKNEKVVIISFSTRISRRICPIRWLYESLRISRSLSGSSLKPWRYCSNVVISLLWLSLWHIGKKKDSFSTFPIFHLDLRIEDWLKTIKFVPKDDCTKVPFES